MYQEAEGFEVGVFVSFVNPCFPFRRSAMPLYMVCVL